MQYSGFNFIPSPFNVYPPAPYGGNPANSGFVPSGVQTDFGPLADMIVKMILSGVGSKIGETRMSFGRPQVSDFAYRSMQDREAAAQSVMAGIYGSAPTNRIFGDLGKNSIFQQFLGDYMSGGGSRSEMFRNVYGSFGRQFDNEGGTTDFAAKMAAQVVRNMDEQFSDESGMWDYSKTAGFNRQNFTEAIRAYTKAFGGENVIQEMSRLQSPENSESIKKTSERMTEMAEVIREAGNFFGPNMPFDQLTQEMKALAEMSGKTSMSEMKSTLQKVQAIAATVDIGNEAMANYIKAIGEINKASGSSMNTLDLASESMMMGKALENIRRKEAEKRGDKEYTGPGQEELGAGYVRLKSGRELSQNAIWAKTVVMSLLENNALPKEKQRYLADLTLSGNYEQAGDYVKQLYENKEISDARYADAQQTAAMRISGELEVDKEAEQKRLYEKAKALGLDPNDRKYVEGRVNSILHGSLDEILRGLDTNFSSEVKSLGGMEGVKKVLLTEDVRNNIDSPEIITEEILKRNKNIGKDRARVLAGEIYRRFNSKQNKQAAREVLDLGNPELLKEQMKIEMDVERNEERIRKIAEETGIYSDKTFGEAAMRIAVGALDDFQKSKGGKPITLKDADDYAKMLIARSSEEFGGDAGQEKAERIATLITGREEVNARMAEEARRMREKNGRELTLEEERQLREKHTDEVFGDTWVGQRSKNYDKLFEEEKKKLMKEGRMSEEMASMEADKRVREQIAKEEGDPLGLKGGKNEAVDILKQMFELISSALKKMGIKVEVPNS